MSDFKNRNLNKLKGSSEIHKDLTIKTDLGKVGEPLHESQISSKPTLFP